MTVGTPTAGVFRPSSVSNIWRDLNLARRFAVLALALSVLGTLALGAWVSNKIEQSAMGREASSAALYMDHYISPLLQELDSQDFLSPRRVADLDKALKTASVGLRVQAMKIWSTAGRILYSSNSATVGEQFPIEGSLRRALEGRIASEFDSPSVESEAEHAQSGTLLEIYAPVRSHDTGEIIAVAEFYERGDELKADLATAKFQSWVVTGAVLLLTVLAFSSLIRDGSRTIESQKRELTERIAQLSDSVEKTKELRDRIENGAKRVMEEQERFLRDVGSDLHDGPVQLISLALLKLDELNVDAGSPTSGAIRCTLRNALRDIREICSGLVLPNLEGQKLQDCLRATVRDHELKTGARADFRFANLPEPCPAYIKICLCRFVQEGLSNAFRHAGGRGQDVSVEGRGDGILAEVSDTGPGIVKKEEAASTSQLGLIGLRGRLESLRGTLTIESRTGGGTTLSAWLPLGVGGSERVQWTPGSE